MRKSQGERTEMEKTKEADKGEVKGWERQRSRRKSVHNKEKNQN